MVYGGEAVSTHEQRITATRSLGPNEAVERLLTEARRAGVPLDTLAIEAVNRATIHQARAVWVAAENKSTKWPCAGCGHKAITHDLGGCKELRWRGPSGWTGCGCKEFEPRD